jgi:hypothetical protein
VIGYARIPRGAARISFPSLCLIVVLERSQSARTIREICPRRKML